MSDKFAVPEVVRRKALNLGEAGVAWLCGLDGEVAALAREWDITVGPLMHGGTEALVGESTTREGRRVVLKVGLPGSESGGQEARVLLAAAGRGYAELFR